MSFLENNWENSSLRASLPVLLRLMHSPNKVPCIMFSKPCNHATRCHHTVPEALQSVQNLKIKFNQNQSILVEYFAIQLKAELIPFHSWSENENCFGELGISYLPRGNTELGHLLLIIVRLRLVRHFFCKEPNLHRIMFYKQMKLNYDWR